MPFGLQTASHIASSLLILAAIIVATGVIAFVAARKFGHGSRIRQQVIFSLVGAFGLICAGTFTIWRLRAYG
jgi:Ca2+/Na+ antiporter